MEEVKKTKVKLEKDFAYMRNGCWREEYQAGDAELDDEALAQAKALGLIKKGKEN